MYQNKIQTLYYKCLVIIFYYIGDIACRINSEFTFNLYQKSMNLSVKYDEKIGWWYWQEPLNRNTDL
jgi:hypothetical protein